MFTAFDAETIKSVLYMNGCYSILNFFLYFTIKEENWNKQSSHYLCYAMKIQALRRMIKLLAIITLSSQFILLLFIVTHRDPQ